MDTAHNTLEEIYGLETTTMINQSPSGIINDKKSSITTSQWSLSLLPIGFVSNKLLFVKIKPIVRGL